eukprot:scaffold131411_cov32-Tisochrysis_lutea.AAC.2
MLDSVSACLRVWALASIDTVREVGHPKKVEGSATAASWRAFDEEDEGDGGGGGVSGTLRLRTACPGKKNQGLAAGVICVPCRYVENRCQRGGAKTIQKAVLRAGKAAERPCSGPMAFAFRARCKRGHVRARTEPGGSTRSPKCTVRFLVRYCGRAGVWYRASRVSASVESDGGTHESVEKVVSSKRAIVNGDLFDCNWRGECEVEPLWVAITTSVKVSER